MPHNYAEHVMSYACLVTFGTDMILSLLYHIYIQNCEMKDFLFKSLFNTGKELPKGLPQRTSAIFRGGGGTQLQTFANFRGEGSQECRRMHFLKDNQDTFPIKNFLQFVLL